MTPSLGNEFGHKVVTVDQLVERIGPRPRDRRVIMCHGVFDIVHPGHLRHLLYAKSKADILVASLTADRFITKGTHRPHVPQELRALSLAAFQFVDYVVVDEEATPISNIRRIQPDFFAKGYEYVAGPLPPKTREEMDTLASFGGEMLFTPGDIVYSSSRLIDLEPPNLRLEKLATLLDGHNISFQSLYDVLDRLGGRRVHIVGDTIIDSYTQCAMIGGQTKTPTMSVIYERRDDYVGGAGIVAKHLRAAGAEVVFSTVVGSDTFGDFAIADLLAAGVDCRAIKDPTRPTTNKNAIVAGGYRLLKVDTLDNRSISENILDQLMHAVRTIPTDGVVFSDFRHGMFNRRTIPALTEAIPSNVYRVADSQVASRWGNIIDFQGFDLITPNEREARFATGDQDSGIRPLASQVYDRSNCKMLVLKLGERGVLTCRSPDHASVTSFFVIDSFVDQVVDAVGAGDALLAYTTLAMMESGSEVIASVLGSIAAACEVEVEGNVPVHPSHVREKLNKVERLLSFKD